MRDTVQGWQQAGIPNGLPVDLAADRALADAVHRFGRIQLIAGVGPPRLTGRASVTWPWRSPFTTGGSAGDGAGVVSVLPAGDAGRGAEQPLHGGVVDRPTRHSAAAVTADLRAAEQRRVGRERARPLLLCAVSAAVDPVMEVAPRQGGYGSGSRDTYPGAAAGSR